MTSEIKISIIIPIHRVEASYLKQCLHSLHSQTTNEFEAILISNGSTNIEMRIAQNIRNQKY